MALIGIGLLAFSGLLEPNLASEGGVLVVLAFLLTAKQSSRLLIHSHLFWLAIIFSCYVVVRALIGYQEFPELSGNRNPKLEDLIRASGLVSLLIAIFLRNNKQRIHLVLWLAAISYVLGCLNLLDWLVVQEQGLATRSIFVTNPNIIGLFSAAASLGGILGLLHISRRTDSAALRLPFLGAMTLFLAFSTTMLILSQSRSAWLAMLLVTPAILCAWWLRTPREQRPTVKRWHLAVAVCILASLLTFLHPVITERWERTQADIGSLSMEIGEKGRIHNISTRLEMWRIATETSAERPIFGWGHGSAQLFLLAENPELLRDRNHFHSLYLTLLNNFGLTGLLLFISIYGAFSWRVVAFMRHPGASPELPIFLLGSLAIFAIVTIFQLRLNDTTGVYYLILFGALAMALNQKDEYKT